MRGKSRRLHSLNTMEGSRRPRPKAYLACDTCRRRKSRCDGLRPACSHCLESEVTCHYRAVPTGSEQDASVLARLASAEARIETLENQVPARLSAVPASTIHESGLPGSALPRFHHSANHKILQYWSRLRVQMTVPDIQVLSYIKDAEAVDIRESLQHPETLIQRSLARQALQVLRSQLHKLPIALDMILTTSRLYQEKDFSIELDSAHGNSSQEEAPLRLSALTTDELLLYAIAFRVLANESDVSTPCVPETAQTCFSLALDRLWDIVLSDDEEALELLLALSILHLDFFHHPFHALALLKIMAQSMEGLIGSAEKWQTNFPHSHALYYLLQSDILSELDGIPMSRTPIIRSFGKRDLDRVSMVPSPHAATPEGLHLRIDGDSNMDGTSKFLTVHSTEDFFSWNLWLRARLNKIIYEMYTTDQAYCKPQNVASIITQTSSDLEMWYRSLPVDLQFIRDVKSFEILQPRMPNRLKELSIRYYSCILALHRPVLYWVLYEDIENSTPSSGTIYAEQQLEPWIFASCLQCIESAKLIIHTLSRFLHSERTGLTWCETQLLVGSFAVLLSVQTATSFSSAFRNTLEISQLLDSAEEQLSTFGSVSLGGRRTLEMLLNIRRNFEVSSPLATTT